jgi:predicted nucleotidyltransferase/DNA-binding HxlR family transcriptional regulator
MRFHEPLDDILGNRTQIKLLRLLSRTRSAHTGRELARLIDLSHNSTRYALDELERNGLIVKQQAGRSNLYSLDEDNIIFTEILSPAFKLEEDLLGEVARIFSDKLGEDLVATILFGSVAKGEEHPNSDIDLVLVFGDEVNPADREDEVAEASLQVAKLFGNQVSTILLKNTDFERKKNARRGLWREIAETGLSIGP